MYNGIKIKVDNLKGAKDTTTLKKELAKLVKEYRDAKPEFTVCGVTYKSKYPKLMMTTKQMENGTATINTEDETEKGKKETEELIEKIQETLIRHNATATAYMDLVGCNAYEKTWLVRIKY